MLVSGMNAREEHTLTVFRKNSGQPDEPPLTKIAELVIDGSISVQEGERTQAYQLGMTRGQSFDITAVGRDPESSNIMDQVEMTYTYNPVNDRYEVRNTVRVPGSQIEQQRLRELLSGNSGVFEGFIEGLWYYVSPQGTIDNRQYIYFDPLGKELIFYADETQQVFTWQSSSPTRYGLYVASQNISVTTLRRFLNIELESLDSIRVKVQEDVRLPINISDSWDGSYRKASNVENRSAKAEITVTPYLDAVYDGSLGKIVFSGDGTYELFTDGASLKGKYAFFMLDDRELLELRPSSLPADGSASGSPRETYLVDRPVQDQERAQEVTLVRVRLGTRGIQELHETAISLVLIS
ncbi:hypothetical protein FACS1894142_5190 [Spirochaetia bacterium]|nr:hypothetical protein FACS1894142_5190 [Spirochaetia bacterium]